MPQDFEKNSSQPDFSQSEIESLLTAFYSEQPLDSNRAEHLWQRLGPQLKSIPPRPRRFGRWFNYLQIKRNKEAEYRMKNEIPLLEHDETDFLREKAPTRNRVGSLVGGLAALALVLGLVAVLALTSGKGPSGNPKVAGQPVATNTIKPESAPTPPPTYSLSPLPVTVDPKASPTPVPFDGKTTVQPSNNPAATPTPLPATVTAPNGTDTAPLNLLGVENVTVNGLANVPVAFDYKTLPGHMLATNPQVHFYASKNDPAIILNNLPVALKGAGYEVTPPLKPSSFPAKLPVGGIYIMAKKAGQPDLYLNLVSIASADEVSRLSKTAYYSGGIDFENGVNSIRVKGYNNLLLVISGNNLLQAITGGSDPGAGSPTGTPTAAK